LQVTSDKANISSDEMAKKLGKPLKKTAGARWLVI
jgi:hypothetical protein